MCHTLIFVYLHFDYHHSFEIEGGGSTITCTPNIGYLQLQWFGPNLYDLYLVPTCVGSSSFKTNAHWIEWKVIIPSKDIQFAQTMSRNHHEGGHESFNPRSQNGILGRFCGNQQVNYLQFLGIWWDNIHWTPIHFSQHPLGVQCYKILSSSSQVPWWLVRLFGVGLRDMIHTYLYCYIRDSTIWLHFLGSMPITLFTSVTMFCATNNIPYNILRIPAECRRVSRNILWDIVNPT